MYFRSSRNLLGFAGNFYFAVVLSTKSIFRLEKSRQIRHTSTKHSTSHSPAMNMMQFVALLTVVSILTSVLGDPSGAQIASTVVQMFAKSELYPVDVCVLGSRPSHAWSKFLDDFLGQLFSGGKFTVSQVAMLKKTRISKFRVYVVLFLSDRDLFEDFVNDLLLSKYWNRYAKFIFVSVDVGEQQWVQTLYRATVHYLGIMDSVLSFVNGESDDMVLYTCNFFNRFGRLLNESETVEEVLMSDKLKNVNRYPFKVAMFNELPFLYMKGSRIVGPHYHCMVIFAEYVNATLIVQKGIPNVANRDLLTGEFVNRKISVINILLTIPHYSESSPAAFYNGLCFMVPETLVGTMFYHLLRPFSSQAWIAIGFMLIACVVIENKFQTAFPRGILNQLVQGAVIADYKMKKVERFLLFTATVVLFLLCSAYEAKLFQFIFGNEYKPHLETVEELVKTDYDIYVTGGLYSENLKTKVSSRLLKIGNKSEESLYDSVHIRTCTFVRGFVGSKKNMNLATGKKRFYVMKEEIFGMNSLFTHSRVQPFSKLFTFVYKKLLEAGIMTQLKNELVIEPIPERGAPVLTYDLLISLWKLLAIGYGLSSGSLLVEIFWEMILNRVIKYRKNMSNRIKSVRKHAKRNAVKGNKSW